MRLFSNYHLSKIIAFSMLILFTFTGIGFASSSKQLDYVALGDSLAAGWTPNGTIDKSYTDIIAEKLDEEGVLGNYNNFGYPGYKTDDVIRTINPLNPENSNNIASIKDAEIITLDIGANDLIDSLRTDPAKVPAALQGVVLKIAQIIGTLRYINSDAKIYLMGYYNAFAYLPENQQAQLIPLIEQFNSAIKGVASKTGATYVDTYSTMDKHITKYLPEENIHPNVSGYRAIAKEFWNIIKVDFLRD